VDDESLKAGLLMEAAHSQQRLAESCLRKLKGHVGELGEVVREEIRLRLSEELQALASDSRHAAAALQRLRRSAGMTLAVWALAVSALCSALVLVVSWWILPSRAEISALRARQAQYIQVLAQLERQGARIELQKCGIDQRLCVRVDRRAPPFGNASDFMVVKGY
jgi:hypothetical protein